MVLKDNLLSLRTLLSLLKICADYGRGGAILLLCLQTGTLAAQYLPGHLPGTIIGLLLLWMLLVLHVVPVEWIQTSCQTLLRLMTLFFIPISVGIMDHYQDLVRYFSIAWIACTASTLLVLGGVGCLADYFYNKHLP